MGHDAIVTFKPNSFFHFACFEVDPTSLQPVFGSVGLTAQGQINAEGSGVYDQFYGTF